MTAANQAMIVMITNTEKLEYLELPLYRIEHTSIRANLYISLLVVVLILNASPLPTYAGESEETPSTEDNNSSAKPEEAKIIPPDWCGIIALNGGWLKNETTVNFSYPQKGADTYTTRELTMTGDGWGAGLVLMGFYKWISVLNVFYFYPDVNNSKMWGNITQIGASIPTGTFVEPYIGMGLAYIGTSSNLTNFRYIAPDHDGDIPTFGSAHFPQFRVDTRNLEPMPKVGIKFKLPIHSWFLRPYYEFLYENLYAHARTPGGGGIVDVYRRPDGYRLYQIEVDFDKGKTTEYMSNVVGIDFSIDYNYFLRLQGTVNYNIEHNLTSTRLIGTVIFSRYLGFSAFFEYQDMIMVDNIYVMVGPCFLFMPSDFMDSVEARKQAAFERRRKERARTKELE